MLEKGYEADQSEFGNVYYPKEGIVIPEKIVVNYVEHPWITCFEVEGIEIAETHQEQEVEIKECD